MPFPFIKLNIFANTLLKPHKRFQYRLEISVLKVIIHGGNFSIEMPRALLFQFIYKSFELKINIGTNVKSAKWRRSSYLHKTHHYCQLSVSVNFHQSYILMDHLSKTYLYVFMCFRQSFAQFICMIENFAFVFIFFIFVW